jgi:sugar phosphate isomerase/epimerase
MFYPIGLQLYSLRRETAQNPAEALRQIPSLGFGGIELAGVYKWNIDQWKVILAETGLVVLGAHISLEDLEKDFSGQVSFQKALGNQRIVIPWLAESLRTAEGFSDAAQRLNRLAAQLKLEGIDLLYHNHDFEFHRLSSGGRGIDILLSETDPARLRFEVDTCWVERGGLDSRDYITMNAPRIGMIHAKELRKKDNADVPAGQGDIDFPAITALALKHRWPVIVEFEGENAPAAVAASARYLTPLLQR